MQEDVRLFCLPLWSTVEECVVRVATCVCVCALEVCVGGC